MLTVTPHISIVPETGCSNLELGLTAYHGPTVSNLCPEMPYSDEYIAVKLIVFAANESNLH